MQHSAQTGSGRRQDRVPLGVGIDLRGLDRSVLDASGESASGELGEQAELAADGLNVSIGGIAMRAGFVPPLGTRLECSFECPPTGELVCAQGEVVWSERCGPDEGQFGLRFVELDTKSATALRRFVAPANIYEVKPERSRAATLVIDGLGTVVEAELKLADDSRIVLEQQLSFLQLGRGVDVQLPGRGKERGRIASVELRHTHFDVPTLVFGVLLDETPERSSQSERVQVERFEAAASKLAPLFSTPEVATLRPPAELPVTGLVSARMRDSGERISNVRAESDAHALKLPREPRLPRELLDDEQYLALADDEQTDDERRFELPGEPTKKAHVALPTELLIYAEAKLPASAADSAPAMCVDDAEVLPDAAEESFDDESRDSELGLSASASSEPIDEESSEPELQAAQARADAPLLALRVRNLPAHLRALFRAPVARLQGLRQRIEPALREQAEYFDLPDAKTRLLLQLARLRALLLQSWSKVQRSTGRAGPRAPRALRVQRSTLLGLGPAESERAEPTKRARTAAIAFAVLGAGLCAYALAPRSSADRIKLPERVQGQTEPALAEPSELSDDELDLKDEPVELEVAPKRKRGAARDPAVASAAAVIAAEAAKPVLSAPFGEADIPNGRVFTLRMNGPVQIVEGEVRENGITVRVPGRQALDRASPIAASHSAVQRAMILNRGGFAELTIDFVPGTTPHYQVRGKDNTLEVTLERL